MSSNAPASAQQRQRLEEVRLQLLRLHKAVLDAEKVRYERANGRVDGGLALFHLVSNDPFFAWLRPMTTLIVQFDEKLDAKRDPPLTEDESKLLLEETRALLTPRRDAPGFHGDYDRVVQGAPDVLIMHTRVERLLG